MATDIKLPSLGEGVESADVLEIFVSEGQTVAKGEGLIELETDKATVTVPSPSAGKIVKLAVKNGQTLRVGDVIASMEGAESGGGDKGKAPAAPAEKGTASGAAAPAKPAPAPAPAAPAPAAPAPQPARGSAAASPAPARPAKTTTAPPAPAAPAQPQPVSSATAATQEVIPAGPAIRRFAREVGVDLAGVRGTGEGGRITREDVLEVVRQASQSARAGGASANGGAGAHKAREAMPGTPASDEYGPISIDRMSKIRKTIANQMHRSWSEVPRVTNFDDADVTELEAFRQSSKDDYAARGVKLTTMPFLIKAVATALRHHPTMNAAIDMEHEQIIYKDYVNIGIAVDTERGLVVPTLKNVDRMSIPDIAQALGDLSARVRNNDFGVHDLRGGTFTISNLGAIGGTYSTPVVNVPEVAILLIGRTRKLPVVMEDDEIRPRLMMPLSLAYDHRLVDGGTAARFLNDVIAYLEAPSRLLLAI